MMKEGTETTLENLVNQIAHDVRNHAFTMGLQAEMGLRRAGNTPEIKAHFEAVLRQVDALKHYLEQLLLFGRPIRLTLTSVDLVALLREQVQRLQFEWDPNAPPFEVKVETEGQLRRGSWDPRALSHALLAVLDNAVRSAAPPPPVSATVRGGNGGAEVEVRDSGPGIPPDVLAKLTVPMAVRRAGGAGLGLAIARKMVEAHGGRLELASGAAGTTARIVLPWEAVATPAPSEG
ncbi:MAG TPA: ATP-binding protein [Thermoanaerobaculaceae bacterium]|nr:ATP-binding protein [Thermoanaerobaculaceae bacterium]